MSSIKVNIGRVFADEGGEHGNPVGLIVDDSRALDSTARARIAQELAFSEIVFVNDVAEGRVSIVQIGGGEIPFAGHAAVGAADYLLKHFPDVPLMLRTIGTEVVFEQQDEITWVIGELRSTPPWWHERIDSVSLLLDMKEPSPLQGHTQLWAWQDVEAGIVRARTFALDWDITEDEANGSGCMRLAATLGRELKVIHGRGSVIYARPTGPGLASVGGRVVWDAARTLDV